MNKYSYRTARNADIVSRVWGKSLKNKNWYEINAKEGSPAEIRIYDVIGWPFIEADTFISELDSIKSDEIRLRINSPGGDVFDGTAIYNAIKSHPAKFHAEIEGLAASMGSIIALAADTVSIADNAWYMIHNPWTFMVGDYDDLRKEADLLERMAGVMAKTYQSKTGLKIDEIRDFMSEETWFDGEQAVEKGFADSLIHTDSEIAARFNTNVFENAPEMVQAAAHNISPGVRDAERSLRDAGFSRAEAKAIVSCGFGNQRDAGQEDTEGLRNLIAALQKNINKETKK